MLVQFKDQGLALVRKDKNVYTKRDIWLPIPSFLQCVNLVNSSTMEFVSLARRIHTATYRVPCFQNVQTVQMDMKQQELEALLQLTVDVSSKAWQFVCFFVIGCCFFQEIVVLIGLKGIVLKNQRHFLI